MEITQSEIESVCKEVISRGQSDWDLTIGSQRPVNPVKWESVEQNRRKNTSFLKEIVTKYGWPSRKVMGSAASHWAWYIVQHSDEDVAFQEECLEKMGKLPSDEVDFYDLAYLSDRVRVNKHLPQLYGTQHKSENGVRKMLSVENMDELEIRRKEVGLDESFEDHHKRVISE